MKVKVKTVYYCEYCGKKMFVRKAMERHEKRCTRNPNRSCGMCQGYVEFDVKLRPSDDDFSVVWEIDMDHVLDMVDGCPACALAIFHTEKRKLKQGHYLIAPEHDWYEKARDAWWKEVNANRSADFGYY